MIAVVWTSAVSEVSFPPSPIPPTIDWIGAHSAKGARDQGVPLGGGPGGSE